MAKFYQGPAPQQAEFDALGTQVDTLNSNLTQKIAEYHKGQEYYASAGTYSITLDPNRSMYLMGVAHIDINSTHDGLYLIYINNANGDDSKVIEIKSSDALSSITIGRNGVVSLTTTINWVAVRFVKF